MSSERLRLAVIIGSVREGRFAPTVANWFVGHAEQRDDMDIEVIDLAETPLPVVLTDQPGPAAALTQGLAASDAFVVVTPEYNHGYPASLKSAIDWHHEEWQAKPIGFVSYGGLAGGLRAVEQLRPVFAEVHAITVRDTVSFHNAWAAFDAEGQPKDPDGCNAAAKTMLDQLAWWGTVLRDARTAHPYKA